MKMKLEQISKKDKISNDPVLDSAFRIGYKILSEIEGLTQEDKIEVKKLRKNQGQNYWGMLIISLVSESSGSFFCSFDLTHQELKSVDSKIEYYWNTIVTMIEQKKALTVTESKS